MAFDPQALWDLSGPTALPSVNGDDFMQLLEKQMQAAHPTTGSTLMNGDHTMYNPAGLMVAPAALMSAPPAQIEGSTPSLTDESSPSPPASFQENNSVGDGTKRKAGRDSSRDGQPRAKVQHKASDDGVNSQPQDDSAKKAPARRKSGGANAATSDENRLAKRKEQNRAAQRAFRDRKEKHVKDLEDKIRELEDKFSTSESENSNLKDLLKRLQNENMMLKQSAFTFEFAPKDNQNTSPNNTSISSLNTNPFTSPAQSSKSSASPESTTSPYVTNSPQNSLFKQTPPPQTPMHSNSQDNIMVNAAGFTTFAPSASAQPTPATPALSISSPGAGPSTINHNNFNHNSLFTSYRDQSAYSFGVPLGDFNTLNTTNIGAEFGLDFGMDMSLGSTDLGAFGLGSDFDDLFGGQLGALDGTSSYGGVGGAASPNSSIPTPQTAVAPTPISKPMIIDGLPSVGESARVECSIKAPAPGDWRRCPKTREEVIDLVKKDAAQPQSTFGPPLQAPDRAQVEQEWEKFTEAYRHQEPDMDNLCSELFDKAQCTELKTRMKASMMRIAKDMANGHPA
ncbi:bZIP transcription factor [Ceratobasidium sp. AG-Ba]|nr:bZIP transcription factor [Ceratobasidium sp. AG-Ba]QRW05623.1 bZIP transcription factor [Ceratobasidium sp. AG-Ba]